MKKYKCSGCGKELEPSEISMIGPEVMTWCDNSVCRGQAKFILEVRRLKEVEKLEKIMKDTKNIKNIEVKLMYKQFLKLLEKPLIFHICEDVGEDDEI